jgi:hypothetical protein
VHCQILHGKPHNISHENVQIRLYFSVRSSKSRVAVLNRTNDDGIVTKIDICRAGGESWQHGLGPAKLRAANVGRGTVNARQSMYARLRNCISPTQRLQTASRSPFAHLREAPDPSYLFLCSLSHPLPSCNSSAYSHSTLTRPHRTSSSAYSAVPPFFTRPSTLTNALYLHP